MKQGIVRTFIVLISITSLLSGMELSIFNNDKIADIEHFDLDEEEGMDDDVNEDNTELWLQFTQHFHKQTTRSKFYSGVNQMYSVYDVDVISPPPERIS